MSMAASDIEASLSDPACRIFVISSSLPRAISFIDRIRSVSSISTEPLNRDTLARDLSGPSSDLIKVPWTITNKYYSAPVHFAAHTVHGLSSHQVQSVPAVIFVWARGESYKHHIERIHQDLTGCEPEVCLAVRIPPESSALLLGIEDEPEGESDIDSFLASCGFEYIDAIEVEPLCPTDGPQENSAFAEGIPGLSRVLDALSTIMWPSMQAKSKNPISMKPNRQRERAFLDWAQSSHDNSFSTADDTAASQSGQLLHEMQTLARWLEEDDSLREDPWKSAASSGEIRLSPKAMEFGQEKLGKDSGAVALGFEDDFTAFVSASTVESVNLHSGSVLDTSASTADLPNSLGLLHAGSLYRALGSVSDFGGSDDEKDLDQEGDLPTRGEILATSSRIFGSSKTSQSPPSQANSESEEPYEIAPFDLSKVLSTLQEMKTEIANMEDEDERRQAAAKVALGLVYGLEADRDQL